MAFHWRGEEGEERDVTYAELLRDVKRLANVLKDRGVEPGDVVGIFLPMIPEVAVAMLACARIGAPHNVVFGGFSPDSVKERMEFSEAKALITVDQARRKGKAADIKPEVDAFLGEVPSIETVVVVRNTGADVDMQDGRDLFYDEAVEAASEDCPAEPFDAEHPLYVLYTSGLDGQAEGHPAHHRRLPDRHRLDPQARLRPEARRGRVLVLGRRRLGHRPLLHRLRAARERRDVRDVRGGARLPGQGHLVGALRALRRDALLHGADGDPRVHEVGHRATRSATTCRSCGCSGTVGEPINPKAWLWYWKVIGGERCPVVDTWWQTETGAILISPLPGVVPAKPGSATRPLPGLFPVVLDEEGNEVPDGEQGLLAITRPWPSMLRNLYKDPERYKETYFSKFGETTYFVGDAARRDEDGYFWIVGRVDDVVNVSGHRLSTAEVESAIVSHPKVAEAAVIGQADEDTGQAISAFVILEGDLEGSEQLEQEVREHVAKRIGKFARPKRIIWTADVPKTRSGKIMRRLLRDIAEGRELGDVTTLREPGVMKDLESKFADSESS